MVTFLLPTLTVAFAAFCVWLTVRIVNRRERWAKWTLAATVFGLPVLYVAAYFALVTPRSSGTLLAFDFDVATSKVSPVLEHILVPQYGDTGNWDCVSYLFEPIHTVDRRFRPEKWTRIEK